ncbi:MAG: cytochrome c [Bradyrhizobiaceae bacterium]|nr:cytochrome c [Hyphomicrobiales bacterium]MBV9428619.1 cytochrome c [Bradyrhizobiaceae bacterium]
MRSVLSALAAGLLLGSSAHAEPSATNGHVLFVKVGCYQCHGYQGQGGAGPRIAPDPLPFDGLAAFVRTTSGEMPPYTTTILSDNDLADIYAYLQSIPRPPALADVPLLKQ